MTGPVHRIAAINSNSNDVATASLSLALTMGFVLSCCRRRKEQDDAEARPLLKDEEDARAAQAGLFGRLGGMLGALKAGKLPSQEQANRLVMLLLASDALRSDTAAKALHGYELSEAGRRVLLGVREVLERAAQLGLEKNDDDTVQELVYLAAKTAHKPEVLAASIGVERKDGQQAPDLLENAPSQQELASDVSTLLQSLLRIFWLLLSSSLFRLLLADAIFIIQDLTASAAVEVDSVAAQVAVAAQNVEAGARADHFSVEGVASAVEGAKAEVKELGEVERRRLEELKRETTEKMMHNFVARVQQFITTARANSEYRDALAATLSIGRKYASLLQQAAAAPIDGAEGANTLRPVFSADPQLESFLHMSKILLQRFASGHSLDPLLQKLHRVASDIVNLPSGAETQLKAFISDAASYLDSALHRADYGKSDEDSKALGELYTRGCDIFNGKATSPVVADIRTLGRESSDFIAHLRADRATRALVAAIDHLRTALADFLPASAASAATAIQWRKEAATRDIVLWLVPRLLGLIKSLPLPRVEFATPELQVALDSFTLAPAALSTSLLPDHINLTNWNEVRVDNTPGAAPSARLQTTERFSIQLDGVGFAVQNLGYYLRYAPPALLGLSYVDRGLLSVLAGASAPGQGLSLDLSLTVRPDQDAPLLGEAPRLFDVEAVRADVPGLAFSLDRTSHFLLNKMVVQPLAMPTARLVAGGVLQEQVRAGLEALSGVLGQWRALAAEEGSRDAGASLGARWYRALLRLPSIRAEDGPDDDEEAEAEEEADAGVLTTATTLTATGVVRTTVVEPIDGEQEAEETVIAVGLAPQVVDAFAGPADAVDAAPNADAPVRTGVAIEETVEEVEGAVADVAEEVDGAVGEVRELVGEVGEAGRTAGNRARYERGRRGWRSEAFVIY